MESLAERKQKTAKLPLCHLTSTQQEKQVASLNRCTISVVAGIFPGDAKQRRPMPAPKPMCRSWASLSPNPRPHIQILSMKAFHRCIFGILLSYHALLVHSQRAHQLQLSLSKTFLNIHLMRVISRSHRKIWKRFIKMFFFQDKK